MNKQSLNNLNNAKELDKILKDLDKVEQKVFDKIKLSNEKSNNIKYEFQKTIVLYHKLIKNLY
ncbi:MAG: hypothetical protein CMF62_01475 [Magnetococcales bacterium]|nr:hypothetical protein [Magnetococcales bacterium]|tara:strand:- start:24723 stop:24911 length:189 start_codon:yes stop_codon:yes gene_type:complete